jgi:hypothetical protein
VVSQSDIANNPSPLLDVTLPGTPDFALDKPV